MKPFWPRGIQAVLTERPEWATVDARMVIMPKNRGLLALAVLAAAFLAGVQANAAENARETQEFAAQTVRRPHIVIRPRRVEPGPNSKRYCRFWLAKEYRVSGPVIVPQQQCWWQ